MSCGMMCAHVGVFVDCVDVDRFVQRIEVPVKIDNSFIPNPTLIDNTLQARNWFTPLVNSDVVSFQMVCISLVLFLSLYIYKFLYMGIIHS